MKKAKSADLDVAIDAIRAGDLERLRQIGAPLALAGDVSRNMITAAPEHVLIGADFSAIECRVLAWIAGETWKIDAYQQFDETGDPKLEPYCVTASKILKREVAPADEAGRQIGKVCDLAFGFGGGLSAWRRFDASGTYTDAEIEALRRNGAIRMSRRCASGVSWKMVLRRALRTKQRFLLGNIAAEVIGGVLYLTLPSGRRLAYPQARLVRGKFGTVQIVFKDNARGGWSDQPRLAWRLRRERRAGDRTRSLAAAMLRLEAAGYPVVLHVHDESGARCRKASAVAMSSFA